MLMKIQKWSSNSPKLLKSIPKDERSPYENLEEQESNSSEDITFNDPEIISKTMKCLGMSWTPKEDIFHYKSYKDLATEKPPKRTKRGISSVIPSIYDPVGFLQPFIIKGKLILQQTWMYKNKEGKSLDWDDKLPEEINNQFQKWLEDIQEVANLQTNRYIFKNLNTIPNRTHLYLHGFADAGDKAWGICVYIRFLNLDSNKYESHLVFSSSKVAPTKNTLSIPKKELNGVLMACEKTTYVAESLKI